MTPERIKELRAVIAKATPGPWKISDRMKDGHVKVSASNWKLIAWVGNAIQPSNQFELDAAFIVEASADLPSCLDTIEAQAARIVKLEAALKPFADDELHEGLDDGPDDKRTTWPSFRLGDFRAARAALTKGE